MGRLGTKDAAGAIELADRIDADPALELAGVMTHFATADDLGDDDHFGRQLAGFLAFVERVRDRHPSVIAHAANSAASFRDAASHLDMVRCGIAIYGLDPFGGDPADRGLEPALSLESYVADVKRFAPGDSAGYGRRWSAEEGSPGWGSCRSGTATASGARSRTTRTSSCAVGASRSWGR